MAALALVCFVFVAFAVVAVVVAAAAVVVAADSIGHEARDFGSSLGAKPRIGG